MTSPVVFAIGAYLTALLCIIFCIREGLAKGFWHGVRTLLTLIIFIALFWLLESWAGIRAPFYDYEPPNPFPLLWPRFDFGSVSGLFGALGLGGLLLPGAAATNPCAILPGPYIPAAIPIAGGCISFALIWTVRLLIGEEGFARKPYLPLIAPWIVGLLALWIDLALDPALANSIDCQPVPSPTHAGLAFWTWSADASLGDYWFHVPIYNFGVWFAAPAILTALVVWAAWLFAKFAQGLSVDPVDGLLRLLIIFFIGVIFFISPSAANSLGTIVALLLGIIAVGLYSLISRWRGFNRNNPWRWELVLTLAFFALYPVGAVLFTHFFWPLADHIYLLLITVLCAAGTVAFALSPYRRFGGAPPTTASINAIVAAVLTLLFILGYLGNS